ncbi:MAG: universal stress protein [Candidatus Tyrphobacter sp.]
MNRQRILVPVDGSAFALGAVDVAIELARGLSAELLLCYVIDSGRAARLSFGDPALLDGCYDALRADGERYLADAVARVEAADGKATTILAYGDPSQEIQTIAAQKNATMIVMGTHGRTGLLHLLMGSVAEGVMRAASVPVVVVPPKREAAEERTVA